MIRLPKLFKRNSEAEALDRGSARSRRIDTKLAPRSFQRAQESEELALTEDPERQRARHRLIGAGILVLIAVVALPRVLDNKPKSVNNDIAVNIVTSLPGPTLTLPSTDDATKTSPAINSVAAKEKEASAPKETISAPAPSQPPTPTPDSTKAASIGLAAGEEVVALPAAKAKSEDAKKLSNSGKYVIQIGAFASEERAKGWISKMKDQKIPNYVLNKTAPDGTKLFVLRAGPFTDKDAAEAAEKKVKAMGLTPRLVEVGAP